MNAPFFFLHIPKTAGTTLNTVLDANLDRSDVLELYTRDQHQAFGDKTYDALARYRLLRGHVFIANFAEVLDGPVPFKVFTFLRDPVERVISEYFFLKRWPKSHLYAYLNKNDVGLDEYVTSNARPLRQRGRNNMVNSLSGVGTDGEERLAVAWHHLKDRFACFGLLERFDESLLMLGGVMGLRSTLYERHNVRAEAADRRVSVETIERIKENNQLDLALYDLAAVEFQRRVTALGVPFANDLRRFRKINQRFQNVSNLVKAKAGVRQGALVNPK